MSTANERSAANGKVVAAWRAYRDALKERNALEEQDGQYRCSVCLETLVDPSEGIDTCLDCLPHLGRPQ